MIQPWTFTREVGRSLTPREEADALFAKEGLVRISEELASADAAVLDKIRMAIGQVWREMRCALDRAIQQDLVQLYARPHDVSARFELLPSDVWPYLMVADWQSGTAVAVDGTAYLSIRAELVQKTSTDPASLKNASIRDIHDAIAAVYDTAESNQTDPPNILQLPDEVHAVLRTQGLKATGRQIKELGSDPKHKARRWPVGKTRSKKPPKE